MKSARLGIAIVAIVFAAAAACGGSKDGSGFGSDGSGGGGNGSGDGGAGGGGGGLGGSGGDGGGTAGPCVPNPANYDIPGNNCEDDDDGTVDNYITCDTGLSPSGAAGDFVKALDICQMADATHWGLVSAAYQNGYGTTTAPAATQHSILTAFGTNVKPQEGASFGVISTGFASPYDDADNKLGALPSFSNPTSEYGMFKENSAAYGEDGAVPPGFPKASGGCTPASDVHDVIDVNLSLKVPANAQGIAIDFDFYTGEWPDFVCSPYNDGFVAYLHSSAFNGGTADNISFDSANNPITVNNNFFDRCTAGANVGCKGTVQSAVSTCAGGTDELQGTGFYDFTGDYGSCKGGVSTTSSGGATGWLTSQAPVKAGETITIEFIIWNTHDENYDSSVLLDHLTWVPGATVANTGRPR